MATITYKYYIEVIVIIKILFSITVLESRFSGKLDFGGKLVMSARRKT